ncbi:MAG TPA: hypothetical protein VGO45_07785 [Bacteroidia bacterium]|jgi:hypothetical protein|nr:hypothetical protein [Bacteroidia bacterium]
MKKITLFLFSCAVAGYSICHAQNVLAPAGLTAIQAHAAAAPAGLNVRPVSVSSWNSPDGLPYKEFPGVNLGVTSFEMMGTDRIAFLSNASDEIIITDQGSGKAVSRFAVAFAPRDFAYDRGAFYVLNERSLTVYTSNGNILNTVSLPADALGVEHLARYGNESYLQLPSGNSLKIESAGQACEPRESEGWVTGAGHFVKTGISGNSYSVVVNTVSGQRFEKTFQAGSRKTAGVYVTGAMADKIYLDVQTYISESPIQVERHIVAIGLNKDGLGSVSSDIKIPDCYYVLSNTDLRVTAGGLHNMITAPSGVFVYSLSESGDVASKGAYPPAIEKIKYHFNEHLVPAETK